MAARRFGHKALAAAAFYSSTQRASNTSVRDHEEGFGLALGAQQIVADEYRLGVSLGYDRADGKGAANAASDIERLNAAFVFKKLSEKNLLSISAVMSRAWYETHRFVRLPSVNARATSDFNVSSALIELGYRHRYDLGQDYFEPGIKLGASWVRRSQVSETGAGALNIQADAVSHYPVTITPSFTYGRWLNPSVEGGRQSHIYARAGVQLNANRDYSIDASLSGAPLSPLEIVTRHDRAIGVGEAGIDLYLGRGFDLKFAAQSRLGGRMRAFRLCETAQKFLINRKSICAGGACYPCF